MAAGLRGWGACDRPGSHWRGRFLRQHYPAGLFLVPIVVTANINPLPAIASRNLSPAGAIVVDRTTKAEGEEIAIVESMMEVVVKMVAPPCRAPAPSLNTSSSHRRCGHRATMHWAHISPMHHQGPRTASGCRGNARSPETAAAPKTTAAETSATAAETAATAVTTTAAAETSATAAATAVTTTTAATAAATAATTATVSCHGGRAEAQCHN